MVDEKRLEDYFNPTAPPPQPFDGRVDSMELIQQKKYTSKETPDDQLTPEDFEDVVHIIWTALKEDQSGRQKWIPAKTNKNSKWQYWLKCWKDLGIEPNQIVGIAAHFEQHEEIKVGNSSRPFKDMLIPVSLITAEEATSDEGVVTYLSQIFSDSNTMSWSDYVGKVIGTDASKNSNLLSQLTNKSVLAQVEGVSINGADISFTPPF
jgi:hypothetical protein